MVPESEREVGCTQQSVINRHYWNILSETKAVVGESLVNGFGQKSANLW